MGGMGSHESSRMQKVEFSTRIEDLKADNKELMSKLDEADECIKEMIREASRKFIEEKGWKECPYLENCECPTYSMLGEYSGWLVDVCSLCPFFCEG